MDSPAPDIRTPWHPQAAIAAWVVPGLGHVMLGQRRRGVIIGVCIAFIWLTGLLVGGVSVLDREDHPMWFYGQMLMAPSVAVNYVVQNHLKINGMSPDDPYKAHRYQPSFGHVNEQGVLYTALAGLINLLAILDVIYKDPKRLAERIARDRAFEAAQSNAMTPVSAILAAAANGMPMLGYVPFLDPLPVDRWWLLMLLPLVVVISIVYKAIKVEDLHQLPRQAAALTAQILTFLVLTAAALLLISELM